MTTLALGLALAVSASVAQCSGFLLQHLGASERPRVTPRHPLFTLRALYSSRTWVVGLAAGVAGFMLHLAALSLAPLSLVQAFVAGGLALSAPLAAFVFHHPLTRKEWHAVALMAAALAVLPIGSPSAGDQFGFNPLALSLYIGGISLLGLIVAVVSERRSPAALGLGAGVFYGVLDTSLKALTDLAHRGGLAAALRSPWLAVAIVAIAAAFFCFQRALQTSRALNAIALMEAGADSTSILAGFVAFGDVLGASPGWAALHLAAFLAVGVAAWSLAPVQERVGEGVPARPPGEPRTVSHRLA
jgi:drug/metabolite transporter (DMT)-like permease